jgi:hypothetical protein
VFTLSDFYVDKAKGEKGEAAVMAYQRSRGCNVEDVSDNAAFFKADIDCFING